MHGRRLDQLRFPDETKVGLTLLMIYMFLDVTQSFTFGGWHIASWVGLQQTTTALGWLQLGFLMTLLAGYVLWSRRKIRIQLGLRDLASTDIALADDAQYLARRMAKGRGRFLVTSNFGDCNAFCLPAVNESWIVLGAGLRIQYRKHEERVRAVLAHECAHVNSGDLGYVVVAWYVFCVYAALAVTNLLVAQGHFWLRVPEMLPAFEQAGGFLGLIRANARHLFTAGFSGLLAIVGLWFVQRHLFHLREFRADERAAQFGFRTALTDAIGALRPSAAGRPWRRTLALHPQAEQRILRLTSQQPWVRLDTWFLGAIAFLTARILEFAPSYRIEDEPPIFDTANDLLVKIGFYLDDGLLLILSGSFFYLAFIFIMMLHVHRIAVTQAAIGITWVRRLALLWPTCAAIFAGIFLSQLTSWAQLQSLADPSNPWTLADALDDSLSDAALGSLLTWVFTMAIVVLAPRPLRRAPRNWRSQALRIVVSVLFVSVIIQVLINMIGGGILLLFGDFPSWEISGLPRSTQPPVVGLPSLLQAALTMMGLSLLLTLPNKILRQRAASESTVDPGWYVPA